MSLIFLADLFEFFHLITWCGDDDCMHGMEKLCLLLQPGNQSPETNVHYLLASQYDFPSSSTWVTLMQSFDIHCGLGTDRSNNCSICIVIH